MSRVGSAAALLCLIGAFGSASPIASAAGPPLLGDAWVSGVFAASARLSAEIDPNALPTTYHFDYITKAAYEANLAAAKDGFTGALRTPSPADANVGSSTGFVIVLRTLTTLAPQTAYRYRVVAKNSAETVSGPALDFVTHPLPAAALLPDSRGWEMVSPVDKNGGRVDPPGALAGGGMLAASVLGGAITYGSATSFGAGAQGAASASQYIATRTASGWSSENITVALFAGSYGTQPEGTPYQLFSSDLSRGLVLNGRHCRGEAGSCAVPNPPLAGTDAPAGYQNYYLRTGGGFEALLGVQDIAGLGLDPAEFELRFVGASPELDYVVLATCAALSPAAGDGCATEEANLYGYSGAGGLELLNFLPGQSTATPGAALATGPGAVSAAGQRIYFSQGGDLYLREGVTTRQVDADAGGGGSFEAFAADGSFAFFSKAGHLWRYAAATDAATDLTPAGGVIGVLGGALGGDAVYFQDATALKLWQGGATSTVASGALAADPGNWPPATGTARVSADGSRLLFVSKASLTGYDNTDLGSGEADSEVFLYDADATELTCVSCNPTNGRPLGSSQIPGALPNGTSPRIYKPRVLIAGGRRVFFDSDDALVLTDTNEDSDVYQWEAQGTGSCDEAGGCIALISSGRAKDGASFVDASADGADAFFLTEESLIGADPGALDLYDARIGGGFPEPGPDIPCEGDACQALPPEPVDPTLTTLLAGRGNPPVRYNRYQRDAKRRCPRGKRLVTVKKAGKRIRRCAKASGKKRGGRR